MASITELSAKVDALQAALDAEQQQIKDAIDALTNAVAELQVSGGTEAERQQLSDKLDGIIADLQATIPDAPTPEV